MTRVSGTVHIMFTILTHVPGTASLLQGTVLYHFSCGYSKFVVLLGIGGSDFIYERRGRILTIKINENNKMVYI